MLQNKANISRKGHSLHCKVKLLDSKTGYLFHIDTMTQNRIFELFLPKITSVLTSVEH